MLHDAQNSQNFIKYFSSKIADFFIHKLFFIVQKLPKLDSRKFKQFLKKNILWNFVNSGHHRASLKTPRGFVEVLNAFKKFWSGIVRTHISYSTYIFSVFVTLWVLKMSYLVIQLYWQYICFWQRSACCFRRWV